MSLNKSGLKIFNRLNMSFKLEIVCFSNRQQLLAMRQTHWAMKDLSSIYPLKHTRQLKRDHLMSLTIGVKKFSSTRVITNAESTLIIITTNRNRLLLLRQSWHLFDYTRQRRSANNHKQRQQKWGEKVFRLQFDEVFFISLHICSRWRDKVAIMM